MPNQSKYLKIVGQKFDRLLVLRHVEGSTLECQCDCGNISYPTGHHLVSGGSRSCGCLMVEAVKASNTKHGMRYSPEYDALKAAKLRCHDEGNQAYRNYGARGIYVDEAWRNSFETFFSDMGPKPSTKHSLERKDNDGPYSKDNCVWATSTEQNNNRRSSVFVDYEGTRMSLMQACNAAGLPYHTVRNRVAYLGWTFEEAIATQPRARVQPAGRSGAP